MSKIENCIYILTNPQYPGYVKIGYASDLKQRVVSLNTGALVEFVPYAVYETSLQNADIEIHAIIKLLNPILRASKFDKGKAKGKEFFKLEPEEAFELLEHIAKVSGTENKVYKVTSDYKPILDDSSSVKQINKFIGYLKFENNKNKIYFSTWREYLEKIVLKAIDEYDLISVKNVLIDPNEKLFHTKKRDVFGESLDTMQGSDFGYRKIVDGLYMLTNFSSLTLKKFAERIMELFPKSKCEIIS